MRKMRCRNADNGEVHKRPVNPAVRLVELFVLVILYVYILGPALHFVVEKTVGEGTSASLSVGIVATILTFMYAQITSAIEGRLARALRLDFLDPYLGRRLKHTMNVLKRHA